MNSNQNQRATVLNPNSKEYKAALDNRSRQLNPKDPVYKKSREQQKKALIKKIQKQ
jgi:hypothetical protein